MVQIIYHPFAYSGSDFFGPITTHDFHFLSGAPSIRNSYLTLLRPFDHYVWNCFIASVAAISIILTIINKIHSKISIQPIKEDTLQSRNNMVNAKKR